MADASKIEWCDATWQPITGCSVVSPGCTNCYAMRLAGTRERFRRGWTMKGAILAVGPMRLEQVGDEIRLVIPCPTPEEADLMFAAIIEAWNTTGELRLTKRRRSADG